MWTDGEHISGIHGCETRCKACGCQFRALNGEAEGLEGYVVAMAGRDSLILVLDGLEHQKSLRIIYNFVMPTNY